MVQSSDLITRGTAPPLYAGIMAASAPPPKVPAGWVEAPKSSQEGGNTRGLELGMSGMSLMPSFPDGSGSSGGLDMPTSLEEFVAEPQQQEQHQKQQQPSNESIDSARSHDSSSPSSPNVNTIDLVPGQTSSKGIARPPGLGGPGPSLIGKPGHSKNSSASTAQSLTLTPCSSVDGSANTDLYSVGKQASPFHGEGPSMPSLRQGEHNQQDSSDDAAELPNGITTFGSFDAAEGDNDGLLGLDALRDRAHSSPGPSVSSFSSSPEIRGQIAVQDELSRSLNQEQRRPRAVSRDSGRAAPGSRPPLSGSTSLSPHTDSNSLHSDRNVGGIVMPFTNNRSRDPSPPPSFTQDSTGSSGPGVISRPEFRYSQSNAETLERLADSSSLRRSSSTDTGRDSIQNSYMYPNNSNLNQGERNQSSVEQQTLTHKFGSLPSLNTQLSQQRMQNQGFQPGRQNQVPGLQRHQRSLSQPGPARGFTGQEPGLMPDDMLQRRGSDYSLGDSSHRLPPGITNDYSLQTQDPRFPAQQQPGQHNRSMSGDGYFGHGRSMSLTHQTMSAGSLEAVQAASGQRRSSLQLPPGGNSGYYGSNQGVHTNLQRRDALDFVPGQSRFGDLSVPVVASGEEMRMFTNTAEGDNRLAGNNQFPRHERMVSPAHSPLHVNYGHNRHPSDMGSSVGMSSSPMSLGSSGVRATPGQPHDMYSTNSRGSHHQVPSDEDLSHPLLGEHIEVPADDPAYLMHDGRQPMRSYSAPVDQMQAHYGGVDSAHHLPTAGSALPLPKVVYNVKFKRTQRSFVMGPRINRDLKIGTYVKVEADRGEDLGIVVGKIPSEKYNLSGRSSFRGSMGEIGIIPSPAGLGAAGAADLKRIIRLATHDEVSLLAMKREEEEELLKICRGKVRQRGLPMNVVDAEYQFDRHKLTFFFEAEGRIDFRELVRDLFSMYKTRIWMQQLDKNTSATCPTGATAPPPVMMDYGTPIIAPASEFSDFANYNGASGDSNTN